VITTVPLCVDCQHVHDERLAPGPPILFCDRYRSLADGKTRLPCDAVRNFRCGLAGTGFEPKAMAGGSQ
jgi:hypothetical protein